MSLKDKMFEVSKKIEERRPLFTPLDLNESTVLAIYNRCLAKKDTKNTCKSYLFHEFDGFEKTVPPVIFDEDEINKSKKDIVYLYGQSNDVHKHFPKTAPIPVSIKYNGKAWTKNNRYHNGVSLSRKQYRFNRFF